jgi:hypothetical protein
MRRLAIILCGVCLLSFAPEAKAQFSPGGIFHTLTKPVRGALGALNGQVRSRHHHRRSAKRSRTVQEKAAAPAAAAGAAAVAATPSNDAPASSGTISSAGPAVSTDTKPRTAKTSAKGGEPKTYWPGAHEDLIGYIFWPRDYDDKLWAHGFNEILSAVFVPMLTRTASANDQDVSAPVDSAALCGPDGGSTDWPNGRITETLKTVIGDTPANESQQAAIKSLQAALGEAMKAVRSACADIVNAPPATRMQTMLDRLWAIRVAGYLVREPLKTFYETLSGEQKSKFERGIAGGAAALDICTAASTARIPFPLLERTIRPTPDQRKTLAALERKVDQASASLRASCPLAPPPTPIARLDAALDRIDAITYAAGNLAPAFGEFYAGLNQDQRTKLSGLAR